MCSPEESKRRVFYAIGYQFHRDDLPIRYYVERDANSIADFDWVEDATYPEVKLFTSLNELTCYISQNTILRMMHSAEVIKICQVKTEEF